jgi:hypothetical protein
MVPTPQVWDSELHCPLGTLSPKQQQGGQAPGRSATLEI